MLRHVVRAGERHGVCGRRCALCRCCGRSQALLLTSFSRGAATGVDAIDGVCGRQPHVERIAQSRWRWRCPRRAQCAHWRLPCRVADAFVELAPPRASRSATAHTRAPIASRATVTIKARCSGASAARTPSRAWPLKGRLTPFTSVSGISSRSASARCSSSASYARESCPAEIHNSTNCSPTLATLRALIWRNKPPRGGSPDPSGHDPREISSHQCAPGCPSLAQARVRGSQDLRGIDGRSLEHRALSAKSSPGAIWNRHCHTNFMTVRGPKKTPGPATCA
jgi:hypothetical protein